MKELDSLYFHKYRINIRPYELIEMPAIFKGSKIRGTFIGSALRNVVCTLKKERCDDCMVKFLCVYSVIMESPVPVDHPHSGKYSHAPHPYVIVPPSGKRRYFTSKDLLSFDLLLIGKASSYLPYFVHALTEKGKGHPRKSRPGRRETSTFTVESVEAIDAQNRANTIYEQGGQTLVPHHSRIDSLSLSAESGPLEALTLLFETPVRVKKTDRPVRDLPFDLLIERLAERAALLTHFYCNGSLNCFKFDLLTEGADTVATVKSNLKLRDCERYSFSQKEDMNFKGLTGEITYKGDLAKFLPLLRLGEYIHVGKNTTFGLGKYRLKRVVKKHLAG